MRNVIFVLLAIGAASLAPSARAQTYDPNFPVCLHVYGPVTYYECRYTSLAQCSVSASGRAAQCVTNPYIAQAYGEPGRVTRRARRIY